MNRTRIGRRWTVLLKKKKKISDGNKCTPTIDNLYFLLEVFWCLLQGTRKLKSLIISILRLIFSKFVTL